MKCIVPLAGPDLLDASRGLRPLIDIGGTPLLQLALEGRPWRSQLARDDYVFVVRETERTPELQRFLAAQWPGCAIVTLSCMTQGALLSAAAGLALTGRNEPLCVDLADILFDAPREAFQRWPSGQGGLLPIFESDNPKYSYAELDGDQVRRTVEKRVISPWASAGAYFFRDAAVYARALAHSLENWDEMSHAGGLFVCPAMNGVLNEGLEVRSVLVTDVQPIGLLFH